MYEETKQLCTICKKPIDKKKLIKGVFSLQGTQESTLCKECETRFAKKLNDNIFHEGLIYAVSLDQVEPVARDALVNSHPHTDTVSTYFGFCTVQQNGEKVLLFPSLNGTEKFDLFLKSNLDSVLKTENDGKVRLKSALDAYSMAGKPIVLRTKDVSSVIGVYLIKEGDEKLKGRNLGPSTCIYLTLDQVLKESPYYPMFLSQKGLKYLLGGRDLDLFEILEISYVDYEKISVGLINNYTNILFAKKRKQASRKLKDKYHSEKYNNNNNKKQHTYHNTSKKIVYGSSSSSSTSSII